MTVTNETSRVVYSSRGRGIIRRYGEIPASIAMTFRPTSRDTLKIEPKIVDDISFAFALRD
jgi:hypothetical protein